MDEKWFTTEELAKRYGAKPNTLAVWRCQGKGPRFIKIGKLVRYPDSEVRKYEAENLFGSTTEVR
jgi:predicted DNA-binding transcriptional regulator AlpA